MAWSRAAEWGIQWAELLAGETGWEMVGDSEMSKVARRARGMVAR